MLKYFDTKQTQAEYFVEKESVNVVNQWILRLMILAGGENELFSNLGFKGL